jgi:hypothetical protein
MKTIKNIFTVLALVAFTATYAQMENKQVETETLVKSYEVETSKGTMTYTLKVDTKRSNWVTMEKDELSLKEQTRVHQPKRITKVISIKGDNDSSFDNVLYVTYKAEEDAEFKIYPTKEGFTLSVVGKDFRYRLLDRNYSVDKEYEDFFEVSMSK